jgi:hypothetical protein
MRLTKEYIKEYRIYNTRNIHCLFLSSCKTVEYIGCPVGNQQGMDSTKASRGGLSHRIKGRVLE